MLIAKLDPLLRGEIENRMYASEVVDFLGITTEDIIDLLEDRIIENAKEFKDLFGLEDDQQEQE